ncbi:MAG TPA: GH92 family glycosyl hydrolase [Pyrinomonadaceae bacterium]|nr:GH92 family glycosyl hydrolase [Chloracidobacterium sp.]MBK7802161.1 GH92 family glycosyl hydrolase [Chloracidobacterium sp.]MBL0239708.1 GH92 family glycosyl hydrolase [Chloracidobacterium sp.]MBP9936052.1 GH92 family glycosyl hydrolase [Pyrinomonadaceae bacterium]HQY67200.1 GH92 family glycosyl hydrolase [Pyrinomonadaceae bacterium]
MKIITHVVLIALLYLSVPAQRSENYVRYVNPLIGTQKMGHTYPGATVPFGSVQLSPDTDEQPYLIGGKYNKDTYKYCSGYNYDDSEIVGFSHTHFSGTGHSDLGDFLVMPTVGELQMTPGVKGDPKSGFRSAFSHANETAEADYYKVLLEDDNILAEMTSTTRVGFHQYTFPKSDNAHIILDLMHGIYNYDDKNVWTYARVENDHTIVGYRQTNGWARTRTVYFAMEFSKPFTSYGVKNFGKEDYKGFWRKFDQTKNFPEMAGKQLRAYFDFKTEKDEKIKVKFALSPVSTEGAKANMAAEIPHWDFERVKSEGQAAWNRELSKIAVTTIDKGEMTNFYTAMYHAFISPTVYMDTDGQYKGLDQNVHNSLRKPARSKGVLSNDDSFTNYTTFSLWDTYRALHPLFNIIQPTRNRDMVRSMMAHYDQSAEHMLPIWSHYANENWCMIGYHSVSVVADSIITGNLTGTEANKALDAAVQTAKTRYYDGLGYYIDLGYVPEDKNGSSVSKTLEYAYDDWAIAQAAKKLNRNDIYNEFIKRSENWKNVYDTSSGFTRPKTTDGKFYEKFDPLKTEGQGFIEGNAWNYSLYVPHDPDQMIKMMGGRAKFSAHLDELFTMHLPDSFFAETEDITREGIIGGYIHGNEPSHHVAYLYNWTDTPWKTQERVRMILKNQYHPTPDGLGGNDDCGQMSAWYLFSALGFYPVAPASDQYQLGSPAIKTATLHLENGKSLSIEARNQSDKNVYVSKVELNGKPLNRRYITYADITNGGKLVFFMDDTH